MFVSHLEKLGFCGCVSILALLFTCQMLFRCCLYPVLYVIMYLLHYASINSTLYDYNDYFRDQSKVYDSLTLKH